MPGKLHQVKRVESADGVPDGRYPGIWNGYTVTFETPWGNYEAKSTVGLRGLHEPCTVIVQTGKFSVVEGREGLD